MSSTDVERLLRQEHIKPEDLLTDGPNNNLGQQIFTEETTVGTTRGKKTGTKPTNVIRIRRTMVITNHADVLKVFLPYVAFGGAVLLFIQSLFAIAVILQPSPMKK
ncbi:hypothetical protein B9Z55_018760 [Caenorhabditis nigoni]|uniref:Uncharacterized protein n=1 Tax=Caenorhabditis nigoni TaxID=1611254 RepID=A0A2G5TFM9_9PELO|nr:hypothetical protein B9Z55_018760 [Caenorhabditis nigoni]